MPTPFENAKSSFGQLESLPHDAPASEKRRRGTQFENCLKQLLLANNAQPRIRLRPGGEEIDGSFMLFDRAFLLEAKWTAEPMPASALYSFKGKVDGKLIGTIGVFLSMSGYSDDAVEALLAGKELNLILFDRSDIEESFRAENAFEKLLRFKLRAAADEGIPLKNYSDDAQAKDKRLCIVCEGEMDRQILQALIWQLVPDSAGVSRIQVLSGNGKRNSARIAEALVNEALPDRRILVIAEEDGDPVGTRIIFGYLGDNFETILLEGGVEEWLASQDNPDQTTPLQIKRRLLSIASQERSAWITDRIKNIGLESLLKEHQEIGTLKQYVSEALGTPVEVSDDGAPRKGRKGSKA